MDSGAVAASGFGSLLLTPLAMYILLGLVGVCLIAIIVVSVILHRVRRKQQMSNMLQSYYHDQGSSPQTFESGAENSAFVRSLRSRQDEALFETEEFSPPSVVHL